MGNQGILLRKVTLDKTLNQLNIFLKGAFVILAMYMLNGLFLEKNLQTKDIQLLVGLYLLVFLGFFFLKKEKNRLNDNQIIRDLKAYFSIKKFSDVEQLDKSLIKEIKHERKFITNNGQVVGTSSFMLFDISDGQFLLIPIEKIKKLEIEGIHKGYFVTIKTEVKREKIYFKNRKDANELVTQFKHHYC